MQGTAYLTTSASPSFSMSTSGNQHILPDSPDVPTNYRLLNVRQRRTHRRTYLLNASEPYAAHYAAFRSGMPPPGAPIEEHVIVDTTFHYRITVPFPTREEIALDLALYNWGPQPGNTTPPPLRPVRRLETLVIDLAVHIQQHIHINHRDANTNSSST